MIACWHGIKGKKLSAAFWLVFGQGQSVPDAIAMVDEAPAILIEVWAKNGSRSWRDFEGMIHE